MSKHVESALQPLPGRGAGDPHKNTAKCGARNDKDRRTAKRRERREVEAIKKEYSA